MEQRNLAEFLRARLDEDAKVAGHGHEVWEHRLRDEAGRPAALVIARGHYIAWDLPDEMAIHIGRHDPARVLAEVEAKRRLIKRYENALAATASVVFTRGQDDGYRQACLDAIRDAAEAYTDHEDYNEAWRPL